MSLSILLVDGSRDQQQIVMDYLRHGLPGVTIAAVDSSADALHQWPDADLIITANVLFPISGVELVQRIRMRSLTVPILMYTSDDTAVRGAQAAGATRFLDKGPLRMLLSTVYELCRASPGAPNGCQ